MIDLTPDLLLPFIDEARLAPSVHNIQPTRWRIDEKRLCLLGDPARAIPVADPNGRDWRLSHGASLEGLGLALSQRGLKLHNVTRHDQGALPGPDGLVPVAEVSLISAGTEKPVTEPVSTRMSWRGKFAAPDKETAKALEDLASSRDDLVVVSDRSMLRVIASMADQAGLQFLRDPDHRRELLHWMRLSPAHVDYDLDGLNARAMNLSRPEAWAAGLVLGPLFRALDAIGLAKPLVSEAGTNRSAAALVLLHRPVGEDPLISGCAFYRSWLAMERFGLSACPVSVLADWQPSRDALAQRHGVPQGREIVSVFRVGKPASAPTITHTRLPTNALLV